MCGIFGYAGLDRDPDLLERMADSVAHRGPDDRGFVVDDRVGMGMTRLSIIDLAGGHQPIFNEDETAAIVFNGEIYNFQELARGLEERGHRLRTRSDTECIVHLFEERGPDCLEPLRGMFAIAIHDRPRRRLFLARDRLGIKPLYYWTGGGALVFGSELKAVLACAAVPREPNLQAVDDYLALRYVPGPESLVRGVSKLPAAHWLVWEDGRVTVHRYWTPTPAETGPRSDGYYRERFSALLDETTRCHLVSDVPVGCFLSGGIDSTALAVAASRHTHGPLKTFSVGFNWAGDELEAARETARRLGCDHHEVVCRPEDMELLPRIAWHLDEPIGDAIVVPMYLLSRLARQHVKVVLTGEGADEVLAGYLFHRVLYWGALYGRWAPRLVKEWAIPALIERLPSSLLDLAFDYPGRFGDRSRRTLVEFLRLAASAGTGAQYRALVSLFDARDKQALYAGALRGLLAGEPGAVSPPPDPSGNGRDLDKILALQYADWLPDDILMKADKMTMANSVEGRVPFMDHRLVEFLLATPPHLKLRGRTNKRLLREYVGARLPGGFARRPKKAFYVPADRFLGVEPLRGLVETCLGEASVRRRGYFSWDEVKRLRALAGSGDFVYDKQVFSLLMLEIWHRVFIDREPAFVRAAA